MFIVNPYIYSAQFTNEKSLSFDGVDEYVNLSSTPSALVNTANFSFSVWLKRGGNDHGNIIGFATSATDTTSLLIDFRTSRYIYLVVSNGSQAYYRINDGTLGTGWNHVVGVFDGAGATNADRAKLYVNGVQDTGGTFTGTIPATTSSTSSQTYNTISTDQLVTFMNQSLDELAIFDYSLNSSQITSLYNSGVPTDLDNTSGVTAPVHWWRMGDGDTYPTITDVGTTGGNNGTMTNMEAGDIVTDTP